MHKEGSNGRAPRAPAAGRVAAEGVPSADAGQGPLLCCRPPPRAQVGRTASFGLCATPTADTTSTGAATATNAATAAAAAAAAGICASTSALQQPHDDISDRLPDVEVFFRSDFRIKVFFDDGSSINTYANEPDNARLKNAKDQCDANAAASARADMIGLPCEAVCIEFTY